jgi:hypothetical protein
MIHLSVGHMIVDYGKNEYFSDHGPLFQASDVKPVPSYYAGENWPKGDPIIEVNEGLGKPLGDVADRLELLGYTPRAIKHLYKRLWEGKTDERPVPFERLRSATADIRVGAFKGKYANRRQRPKLLDERTFKKLAMRSERHNFYHPGLLPDHWEADIILEQFHPYAFLRLLAENKANLTLDVNWDFTPLMESGWAQRSQFEAGALPEQKFLIVTEGSSDAKIIRKALELYRPHIADFFMFVDMEEGYPFSGTGNLHKFLQGLIGIGVRNNTIVLYDNDAEGIAKMAESMHLRIPPNLRVTQLPAHEDFKRFRTVGPGGKGVSDINGKAASIECYLDLRRRGLPRPIIRWTTFNKERAVYQGELQHKTRYMKDFLNLPGTDGGYDHHRIDAVLEVLIRECILIAEAKQLSVMHIRPSL